MHQLIVLIDEQSGNQKGRFEFPLGPGPPFFPFLGREEKGREGKGRKWKEREGKGRKWKEREGNGRKGKGREGKVLMLNSDSFGSFGGERLLPGPY